MAEKTLKTRISHKIDTLENWSNSTIGLKKGELAIATTAAKAGNGLTEPVAMIKIGEDGVKTFKDLPWNFYAKASDVYSWAKAETPPTFTDTDTQYQLVKDGNTGYKYKLQSKAKDATEWADVTNSVIEVPDKTTDITNLQNLVGTKAVATQIEEAITALKLADTYATKTALKAVEDTANGTKATLDAFLKDADVTANAVDTLKEIQDYITSDGDAAAEVTNKISVLEGKAHEHTNKAVLDGITSDKVTAWDGAEQNAKDYADGLANNYATAAQGAKADTALQSITTTENGGLKVTGNQIDIDEAITFIFDCGNATI